MGKAVVLFEKSEKKQSIFKYIFSPLFMETSVAKNGNYSITRVYITLHKNKFLRRLENRRISKFMEQNETALVLPGQNNSINQLISQYLTPLEDGRELALSHLDYFFKKLITGKIGNRHLVISSHSISYSTLTQLISSFRFVTMIDGENYQDRLFEEYGIAITTGTPSRCDILLITDRPTDIPADMRLDFTNKNFLSRLRLPNTYSDIYSQKKTLPVGLLQTLDNYTA